MYEIASILFSAITDPGALPLGLLIIGCAGLWTRWHRMARALVAFSTLVFAAVATVPIGFLLIGPLENRFPSPEPLPERIDGIVVLGGAVSLAKSASRGQPTLNSNAERLTTFVTLGKRYPGARLLYTGGFRGLSEPPIREGSVASELFVDLGLKDGRLEIDNSARNTIDNAANALEMAKPKQGEVWLLITSARHMPRAMGVFRLAGWPMIVPYPVDYLTVKTSRPRLRFNLKDGLSQLRVAQHEWIGLVAYRLMGASAELFPGPR